jgi:cytochrome c2
MRVLKHDLFLLAVVALVTGISLVIVFAAGKFSGSGTKPETVPSSIKTNMIDLDYQKLFKLEIGKWGGGIGATDTELVVVAGDGQVRVVDLISGENHPSAIRLPVNNESAAVAAAGQVQARGRAAQGAREVKKWLRYDDILIFDNDETRYLVLSYAYFDPDASCFNHRVSALSIPLPARLKDLTATPGDWSLIFSSQPCFGFRENNRHTYAGVQSGGRMALLDGNKGEVVLALGDYEFDGLKGPRYPQDPDADYGKVWKLNVLNKKKEILSIGMRNTQGITVDTDGQIWTVEQGPQGGDELNLIEKGENYGWPDVTFGIMYETRPWPLSKDQGRHEGFRLPVFAWVPSIAVSNIDQSVNFHPFWEGDLLAFSLKTQSIFRLRLHDNHVIVSEPIPFIDERIRYGLNHPQTGAMFLWTDSGTLYKVTPGEQAWGLVKWSQNAYESYRQGLEISVSPTSEMLADCLQCHSGVAGSAPDLAGVLRRKVGGGAYPNYSPALARKNQVWNKDNLKAFLKNPQEFAPGTTMPDPMISGDDELNDIIDALEQLGAESGNPIYD